MSQPLTDSDDEVDDGFLEPPEPVSRVPSSACPVGHVRAGDTHAAFAAPLSTADAASAWDFRALALADHSASSSPPAISDTIDSMATGEYHPCTPSLLSHHKHPHGDLGHTLVRVRGC